ncbi:MAG TPA: Wzz/FepE/Etk N-terminal domain-containing protein [Syntrophobacteraceae bacterium]|nr:Wzz/FepE/Etk N-terminal domain-containing protein [Syntrophobacteraceae bacterium]
MAYQSTAGAKDEINLLDFFVVLLKRKKFILGGGLGVAVLSFVLCMVMSPMYQGISQLMPPQQSGASAAAQMLGQLGGIAGMVLGGGGAGPVSVSDLYVQILQSPAVLDPIIDRFDLKKLYGYDNYVDTRRNLVDNILTVESDLKSGIIFLGVYDVDPKRAAEIANAMVATLKDLLENLATSEAGKRRVFFEGQLKKAHENLKEAEAALQTFAETTGAIKIDDQASAVLQGIANLRAQVAAKEVQLKVMKTYATPSNPDLKMVEQELRGLNEQLKKLEEKEEVPSTDAIIPTGQIPTVGTEYLRRMRDFKYTELLYELLVKQYEAARLDEARESAVVQAIYPAKPPDKKAKPMMILMVVLGGGLGCFLFTVTAVVVETMRKASRNPENEGRFRDMKRFLRYA